MKDVCRSVIGTAIASSGGAALSSPENLRQASCSDGTSTIAWDAVSGATGYRLEIAATSGGAYSLEYSGSLNSFVIEIGMHGANGRWFKVRAENATSQSEFTTAMQAVCNYW